MERAVPVETCLGYLLYRDAIHLAAIKSNGVDWFLAGKINGHNVTKNPKSQEWIPFEIAFSYVQNIFTAENTNEFNYTKDEDSTDPSSFHVIHNSHLIKPNPKRIMDISKLKHYRLKTVDNVMHIIAGDFSFNIVEAPQV